uniref:Ig-like domain-containing protein n=1 Tax=Anabas testudineus TaxID=64144 RepID=A0A7N6BEE8_ANATE
STASKSGPIVHLSLANMAFSKVTVKKGDSITVPCLYDSKYINNVKYLCKGYSWSSCSYAVRTDQPHSSRKFSISDDKIKRIFTVTIKDARDKDTGYYWCAVEINDGSDIREYFHLSKIILQVSHFCTPSLYVAHQQNTGFNGGRITISCHYSNSGDVKWCRLGTSCVIVSSGNLARTTVTIDSRAHSVFTVTMSNLRTESSGWYLCVKGDLQMPVHLTVTEKPSTSKYNDIKVVCNKCISHICSDLLFVMFFIATHTTTCLTTLSDTPDPVNFTSGIVNKALTTAQFQHHMSVTFVIAYHIKNKCDPFK